MCGRAAYGVYCRESMGNHMQEQSLNTSQGRKRSGRSMKSLGSFSPSPIAQVEWRSNVTGTEESSPLLLLKGADETSFDSPV